MSFAVIEGLDGSGKSTQLKLLSEFMDAEGIHSKFLHFPRTNTGVYGDLISRFLRGELGSINEVNPYMVAMLYAGDRMDASNLIKSWIDQGYFVLVDRYVYSNIAFQCAKLKEGSKREDLKKWIMELEFGHFELPVPEINVFLDVPSSFTKEQLDSFREGDDRGYLMGKKDIHEASLLFQQEVRMVYHSLQNESNFVVLPCYTRQNHMLDPSEVFDKLKKLLFI